MDYLTVKEVAELKGCSERYIRAQIKSGKLQAEKTINTSNGHESYLVSVQSLSEELQAKYYKHKRTETGILPEKSESEQPDKEPGLKYRSKGTQRAFDSFSAEERETIQFWIDLLNEWQAERSKRKDKTEFDKLFVAHQKYINADINISPDILYRKYSAYKNECYEELIDKRGGWNRGRSSIRDEVWQIYASLYLSFQNPKVSVCYRRTVAWCITNYPDFVADMYIFLANGDDLTSCICSDNMPPCTDSLCMKTADDKICVGWLASQTDMLAEDWTVTE